MCENDFDTEKREAMVEVLQELGIDPQVLEDTLNEVFPGLAMFVRDVNLNEACAAVYQPGMFLMERGFTDASVHVGGMQTTHRIAILSNHMANFERFTKGKGWGLFVANHHAHFKVLDVYEYMGKTQILLLHLPDDARWELFQTVTMKLENQLIADSRLRFEQKCLPEPIPALATEEWLARCADPIGMDENGHPFDPHEPSKDLSPDSLSIEHQIILCLIGQGLTGNASADITWLKAQMARYENHPLGERIAKECAQLIHTILNQEESKNVHVLHPCASVDVRGILNDWLAEWNETEETSTEQWHLTAFPVLADGNVALLFESTISLYDRDEDGEFHTISIENHYRVLLIDPKTGKQVAQHRFKLYRGFAATVFMRGGKLFAVVSMMDECRFTALQVWPGSDDEHQIKLGQYIDCFAATTQGDILVSYNNGGSLSEDTGELVPMLRLFHPDGKTEDISPNSYGDSENYVVDLTLDGQNQIWALCADGHTVLRRDGNGQLTTLSLPMQNTIALALPDDDRTLYASIEDTEPYESWVCMPMAQGQITGNPQTCVLETPEGKKLYFERTSILKNIAVFEVDSTLYMVDLNEQN